MTEGERRPTPPRHPPRISTAPDLARTDGLTRLARAARHALMLGPLMPLPPGTRSRSTWPRGTFRSFEDNAECAVRADELGFDLVFGLAQGLGEGGYDGYDQPPISNSSGRACGRS